MENQNILIKSQTIALSSSIADVTVSANKDMTVYVGEKVVFTTGQYGSINPENNFTVQSPNIILGYEKDPTMKVESVVKGDQLINVLNTMLTIMRDIVEQPEEKVCILGEIEQLSKQLNKIKSEITKTY